jgi:hypothetical protein
MAAERQVMQGYLDALFRRASDFSGYFSDDVVVTMQGTGRRADGRQAATQFILACTGMRSMRAQNSADCVCTSRVSLLVEHLTN